MRKFDGRVVAITGAGSGIGRALAAEFAGQGAHLALSDIDEVGLAETVARCEGRGVKVTSQRVDVSDRESMFAWADEVVAEHGKVNVVVNNAGVAVASNIDSVSYEDFEWLMGINFWGVVHGTKAFLPAPEGVPRWPHREHLERLRARERAVAGHLQRGEVRRPRIHGRASDGARHRQVRRVGHHDSPGRHQDEHRPQRPHGRRAWWRSPDRSRRPPTSSTSSP